MIERNIYFIQAPPQPRGYEIREENEFYEKYWEVYCKNLDTHKVDNPIWEMPLWVPNLGGILEKIGISSEFIDLSNFCGTQSYYAGTDFTIKNIFDFLDKRILSPSIFFMSPLTLNYNLCIRVAKIIKTIDHNNIVILGGSHVSFKDIESIENSYIDFIVRMDGEYILPKLIQQIFSNNSLNKIQGITYKLTDGKVIRTENPKLPPVPRVDYAPKYDFFPKSFGQQVPYLRVCLNRGCVYHCSFCGDVWNNIVPQEYPIDWTIRDIQVLKNTFNNNLFYMNDHSFSCKLFKERIIQFCEKVKELNIKWIVQVRIDQLDKDVLQAMYNSGCRQLELGFETISQKSLNSVNKGTFVHDMESSLDMLKSIGFFTYGYWMAGLPHETKSDVIKTQDFIVSLLKRNLLDLLNYGVLVPYPGTKIFQNPQKYGIQLLTTDYSKYHEYGTPVYNTTELNSETIFDLWRRGLSQFSSVL